MKTQFEKLQNALFEIKRQEIDITEICEHKWPGTGKSQQNDSKFRYSEYKD